ncbi:MAG: hypothetical protein ABIQ40_17210 [Bacteroidia bacterium]
MITSEEQKMMDEYNKNIDDIMNKVGDISKQLLLIAINQWNQNDKEPLILRITKVLDGKVKTNLVIDELNKKSTEITIDYIEVLFEKYKINNQ